MGVSDEYLNIGDLWFYLVKLKDFYKKLEFVVWNGILIRFDFVVGCFLIEL